MGAPPRWESGPSGTRTEPDWQTAFRLRELWIASQMRRDFGPSRQGRSPRDTVGHPGPSLGRIAGMSEGDIPDERIWLTKAEAAERLRVSTRTVDRLADTGALTRYRHQGRLLRFRLVDVDALMERVG